MSQALVTVVIVVLVIARFLVRELRERRFRSDRIYVLPGALGIIALAFIVYTASAAPRAAGTLALACLVALAFGALVGYAVAHFTTVRVTEEPAVLYARGSIVTVAIWLVALALRLVVRLALLNGSAPATGESLALDAGLILLLASALFFVRYRLLVAAKRERERGIAGATPAI
ncbi:MAG: DUF1453 family protein [Candidatus Eremiobacteraeota bacterium]|nr:DUF1453 family protein [Candidatus Eremiobacteraeota bacterium]